MPLKYSGTIIPFIKMRFVTFKSGWKYFKNRSNNSQLITKHVISTGNILLVEVSIKYLGDDYEMLKTLKKLSAFSVIVSIIFTVFY